MVGMRHDLPNSLAPAAADVPPAAGAAAAAGPAHRPDLAALHGKVCSDLRARRQWLDRQAEWYDLRHHGLRRARKPFPAAADMHFPLADSIIEKLKPFYFNQLFGTETVAHFVATRPELGAFAAELGAWFDYKLKQQTNLEP